MLGLLLPIHLLAARPWSEKHRPRFEDFRVVNIWRGVAAPVRLKLPAGLEWRVDLNKEARAPVNFAGRYKFAIWMCGSNCAGGAIIDLPTGEVFQPPLGKGGDWSVSAGMFQDPAIEFRPNSRLVIIRTGTTAPPDTYYLVWEGNHFQRILFIAGRPSSQP